MRCSNCGSENPAGKRFCSECGAGFPSGCPRCGADSAPAAKFCGECGASLNAPVSTPVSDIPPAQEREVVGERRHLTVLFSDLVGSTEISTRLDPEEWRELVADYHRAAAEAIRRFGGFVAKYLGDGVMAYFGWPEAHDNDAERAARAGLAIVESVRALNQRDGQRSRPKLSVRVGIDSGTVVIGKGGGSDSEVFGDAANIAARVQSAADPDAVIVTPAVYRLVSGLFVVQERGVHQLKGIATPVELYRILRQSSVRNRLAASIVHGLTPFVGRDDETRLLWSCWERASDGEGQVLLIVGEAGIGKSRLVRQFRKRLAPTPHLWIECAGSPYFQNTPFYPIADMLQQDFAQRGDGSDAAKLSELERALALAGLKLAEAVPLIAPMLNLPVGEKYPPLMLSPEQQRKRLMATLAAWLFAAVQSVVMAVEDLHWFDASTLELMQLLIEQAATARVMLVCTARPEFRAPWTPRAHHSHLTLTRLRARDVREMVANVVAQRVFTGEAVERVIERTGGVPLFVEELTRAVLERGDTKLSAREIPATLHDSLMSRLDRLGPAKEVAQIAAVIGREFSFELLRAVSSISEGDLQEALARLGDAELIYARGIPPEADYTFRHALIQDAAYEALLKSRRRELHRRVAVAMTEEFPAMAEIQREVIARHWTEAGEAEPAIAAWRKAADYVFERHAFKEAEEAYRQALEMVRALPESAERDGRELELMSRFAQVLQVTRGWAALETSDAAAHARALAEKSDNLAQVVLQMFGTFAAASVSGDSAAARVFADQMLDLAERGSSPASLGLAHAAQVFSRHFRGDLIGAEEHFTHGDAFFESASKGSPGVAAAVFGYSSHNAWIMGRADTALQRMGRGIAAARQVNNPFELAYADYLAAMLQLFLKQPEQAQTLAAQSVALSDEHGFRQYAAMSRIALGRAQASLGHSAEAVALIRQGLRSLAEIGTGTRVTITLLLTLLAEAQALGGATSDALVTIQDVLQANPEELAWRPETLRLRGELRLNLGETMPAEVDFREAVALARKIGAKAWELRAAMSLGRMLKGRGDIIEARDSLEPLHASFTEGFDTVDLKDVRALLDEIDDVPSTRAR